MRRFLISLLLIAAVASSLSAHGIIIDVSPDGAHPGDQLWVTVTGSNTLFGQGSQTEVYLEIPSVETLYPTQIHTPDPDSLVAYFEIPMSVQTGLYDVVVVETFMPGTQEIWRLVDGFSITNFSDCGDVDRDGDIDIDDAKSLILYVYYDTDLLEPLQTSDINCDRRIDLVDISLLIKYLFRGGAHPCADCARSD